MKTNRVKKVIIISAFASILLFANSFDTASNFYEKNYAPNDTFIYRKITNNAFTTNEKLSYRIHYGFINAASADISIDEAITPIDGRQTYHILAEGKTNPSFDWMYKVRDKFETWVDKESLCPLKYTKSVREDKYRDQDLVKFSHPKKKLFGIKGNMDMLPYTQDVISVLYYARNLDFSKAKVGDRYPVSVYLDKKIYNLQFKFAGRETISSDVGKVKCLKLIPKLVVDRVFKGEEDMTVWVSDDENKIPIRVKSDIQVGSIKVDLTKYSGLKNTFSSLVKK